MSQGMIIALVVGVIVGMTLSVQAIFNSTAGQIIGPVRAGFMLHITGAVIAVLIIIGMTAAGRGIDTWGFTRPALIYLILGGLMGLFIASGAAYAFPRIGIGAGQAAIMFGQMAVAIIIDSVGWGNNSAIPLDMRRIAGVVLMGIAAWLLLPQR